MNFNWDDIEIDNDSVTHNSRYYFANLNPSRHERKIQCHADDEAAAIDEDDFGRTSGGVLTPNRVNLQAAHSGNDVKVAKRYSLRSREFDNGEEHENEPGGGNEYYIYKGDETICEEMPTEKETCPVEIKIENDKNIEIDMENNENIEIDMENVENINCLLPQTEVPSNSETAETKDLLTANLDPSRHERKIQRQTAIDEDDFGRTSGGVLTPNRVNLQAAHSGNYVKVAKRYSLRSREFENGEEHENEPDGGNESYIDIGDENICEEMPTEKETCPVEIKIKNDENIEIDMENDENINCLLPQTEVPSNSENAETNDRPTGRRNIKTPSKWNNQGAVPKTAPKLYEYHTVYENKRQEIKRKQLEEQAKLREFHCKPAPKFHQKPAQPKIHIATVPITPQVLKRSKESLRKRIEKAEELKNELQAASNEKKEYVEPRSFNLRCEQRLQERKKYDEKIQRAQEEKQREEEEKRKLEDEALKREARKGTTFKARPNPFKH